MENTEIVPIIGIVRDYVHHVLKENPRGILHPDRRIFHNPGAHRLYGGAMSTMHELVLSGWVESEHNVNKIKKILELVQSHITQSHVYVQLHHIQDDQGHQIHIGIQGVDGQLGLEQKIKEVWYR